MAPIPVEKLKITKHIASSFVSDLKSMLSILQKNLGIVHFCYTKLYPDKSQTLLTTHLEVSELFITEKFYQHMYMGDIKSYQSGYYLSNALTNASAHKFNKSINEKFYIDHYLIMIKPSKNNCELCFFGADRDNHAINNVYLNNIDVLDKFTQLFKEQGKKMIHKVDQQRVIYPQNIVDSVILEAQNCRSNRQIISEELTKQSQEIKKLTPQEQLCAKYLGFGLSAKEIARYMNISYRTVEKHTEHLKTKLNCSSKLKLICELQNLN